MSDTKIDVTLRDPLQISVEPTLSWSRVWFAAYVGMLVMAAVTAIGVHRIADALEKANAKPAAESGK